jgi:transposase-like protein
MQMVTETDGRRRRHSAAERHAVLKRFSESGASLAVFCRSESISVATLRRWQAEHGDDAQRAAAPRGFLDLGALGGGALTIEVDLGGGVLLRVRRG